jgi:hypothetical protein
MDYNFYRYVLEICAELVNVFSLHILCFLEPAIPYSVTVKALNLAGCGQEQQIYCFTQEGGIHARTCIKINIVFA